MKMLFVLVAFLRNTKYHSLTTSFSSEIQAQVYICSCTASLNWVCHRAKFSAFVSGKTTVAKLINELLRELGIRQQQAFVETKGEKLAQMGADKASKLMNQALGGTLFVDEAYALEPK